MPQFLTFRRFASYEDALAISQLLESNGIPSQIENAPPLLDHNIIGRRYEDTITLKIPGESFNQADRLIRADTAIIEPEPDYYLYSFSDEELKEVIFKKDEWGDYDYALALQLLEQRGISISEQELTSFNQQRVHQLAVSEPGKTIWIAVGYLSAFLGGLLGIFIGGFFARSRKTLPNGERVFSFTPRTRTHGKVIFAFGIIMFVIWIIRAVQGEMPPGIHNIFFFIEKATHF